MPRERQTIDIALIDGGGRGHVAARKYAETGRIKSFTMVPGHDFAKRDIEATYGIPVSLHKTVALTNPDGIIGVLESVQFGLVDVMQDDAIAGNVAGRARELGMLTVGTNAAGGKLESDKAFYREKGKEWGIPQPEYAVFEDADTAIAYLLNEPDMPRFIKAAYLAQGKGAEGGHTRDEQVEVLKDLLKRVPKAAQKLVIEEWMLNADGTPGDEFSGFILTDGKDYKFVGYAADYKRAKNFDEGDNTGSMGSNSPTNLLTPELQQQTKENIVEPLIAGLQRDNIDYQGIIYVSGMVVTEKEGKKQVKVVEINSRWGDPEAQVIIPGIKTDFYDLNMAIATKTLGQVQLDTDNKSRVVVTGASRGYPGNYAAVTGKEIYGIENAQQVAGVSVYGAGIEVKDERNVAKGGRLLYVMGEGTTVSEARERAYAGMSHISVEGNNLDFRTDIGLRDVLRVKKSRRDF